MTVRLTAGQPLLTWDGNGFNDIVIVRRTGPNAATYNNVIILFNDGKGHFVDTNSVYVHQNEILLQQQIKPGIYICIIQLENEVIVFKKLIFNKSG